MKEKILDLLSSSTYKPLSVDELYKILDLKTSSEFVQLTKTLCELEDEYLIIRNKHDRYATLDYFNLRKGIINVKEAGFGFVSCSSLDTDIYVSSSNRNTALNNDEVLIKCFERNGRLEGEVVSIIKRHIYHLIGVVKKYRGKCFVESVDSRNKMSLFIPSAFVNNAEENDIVECSVKRYYDDAYDLIHPVGEGKIVKIYGDYNDPGMDITSLVLSKGYSMSFPLKVMDEVASIKDYVEDKYLVGRTDLTNKYIVTIDSEDAKDFDDAINVELLDNGNYLLGVYIADVSEYVTQNSALDQEAFNRGTSVYLPDRVIPMLPKELSNGICSLNEGVIRLVMACEMEIDKTGQVVSQNIFKGYIKSTARLTYNIVNKILVDEDEELTKRYNYLVPMLKHGEKLAKILYNMRLERGTFDFDTLESKIILDDSLKAVDVKVRERGVSEKMIEEFMLIANDTVATVMRWCDVPFIYRVHDEPKVERIDSFIEYCKSLGISVLNKNAKQLAKSLQNIYLESKTQDDMFNFTIGTLLIRSMSKAKYQTHNIGHYGLASECYTHFTSPIRRYPDLIVHRLVKEFLLNEKQMEDGYNFYLNFNEEASLMSSIKERNADMLQQDADDIKKAEYMSNKIGEKFVGSIISVTNHGIYVVLENLIEGLVRFEYMPNDYYLYLEHQNTVIGEKTNNSYTIGDKVLVELINTNKRKGQIDFKLIKKVKRH